MYGKARYTLYSLMVCTIWIEGLFSWLTGSLYHSLVSYQWLNGPCKGQTHLAGHVKPLGFAFWTLKFVKLDILTPMDSRCSIRFCFSIIWRRPVTLMTWSKENFYYIILFSSACWLKGRIKSYIVINSPTWFMNACSGILSPGGGRFQGFLETSQAPTIVYSTVQLQVMSWVCKDWPFS